jgi:hypothetical protein
MSARHLGLNGNEPVLLGRMAAQIDQRPKPGDRCIVAMAFATRPHTYPPVADIGGPQKRLLIAIECIDHLLACSRRVSPT